MKVALIPPVEHLWDFAGDDMFHLALSHLFDHPDYVHFYQMQHLRGAYVVLDNGAHESTSGEPMQDLLLKAKTIMASEVVLPDTLADCNATVEGSKRALAYLLGPGEEAWGHRRFPALMLVPQGKTRADWERCFQELLLAYHKAAVARPDLFSRSVTVGVSKDYDYWKGGHRALLEYIERFHSWMTFDVHLLGWARNLHTLNHLAHLFPWIRSTDSAKPFVYALHGICLAEERPEYPGRPSDYFDQVMVQQPVLACARANVSYFRRMAST